MYYFAKRYDIKYTAAYDTCSTEGEASLGKVRDLIECIKEEKLGAIYYEELSSSSYETAKLIEKEVGVPALLLHNCHNISKDDFENGETYISLMYKNLDNLKSGMK